MPVGEMLVCHDYSNDQHIDDIDSDQEEDQANDSEQDSENDEDLPLEMDEGRNVSKVSGKSIFLFQILQYRMTNPKFLPFHPPRKKTWTSNILLP